MYIGEIFKEYQEASASRLKLLSRDLSCYIVQERLKFEFETCQVTGFPQTFGVKTVSKYYFQEKVAKNNTLADINTKFNLKIYIYMCVCIFEVENIQEGIHI